MVKAATLAGALLSGVLTMAGQTSREPHSFFKDQVGLSDEQIASISTGKVVAKIFPSNNPAEIVVFGAVFVKAAPEAYVKLALDVDQMRRLPGYQGAGRFGNPPALSDMEGFTLEPDDISNIKSCRPGKCDVQLPARAMQELQGVLAQPGPNSVAQANERVRRMALDDLLSYQKDGNRVLKSYYDVDSPFEVGPQLKSLLAQSKALPVYLPELDRYLLDYPNASLPNVQSLFFWEKINFGMKTTLRMNHAFAYRSAGPMGAAPVVVVKQLYASHYFQLALDLSACVVERGRPPGAGFYLISLRVSKQQGLTGLMGSLLRMIIVSKTRSTQENALANIKIALEAER